MGFAAKTGQRAKIFNGATVPLLFFFLGGGGGFNVLD